MQRNNRKCLRTDAIQLKMTKTGTKNIQKLYKMSTNTNTKTKYDYYGQNMT